MLVEANADGRTIDEELVLDGDFGCASDIHTACTKKFEFLRR